MGAEREGGQGSVRNRRGRQKLHRSCKTNARRTAAAADLLPLRLSLHQDKRSIVVS